MFTRWLAITVLVLAGLMTAISPIAARAASGTVDCVTVKMDHPHGEIWGDVHADHEKRAMDEAEDGLATPASCCDHGYVFDLTISLGQQAASFRETRQPRDWATRDRVAQSGPLGLRRPPKA